MTDMQKIGSIAVERIATWPEARRARAMLVLAHQFNVAFEGLQAIAEKIHETLDAIDGDPDLELADPLESDGDDQDAAWIEWTAMRGNQKPGPNIARHEDDEEDDPPGVDSNEDEPEGYRQYEYGGPGCVISDSDSGVDDSACDADSEDGY